MRNVLPARHLIERAGFSDCINHRPVQPVGIAGHAFPDSMPCLYRPFREREVFSPKTGIYIWRVGVVRRGFAAISGKDAPEAVKN